MVDDPHGVPVRPDELAGARFRVALRGFDQLEVRAMLNRAAERLRALEREVESARAEVHKAKREAVSFDEMDDETLTELLGEETARLLNSARTGAKELADRAEYKATERLQQAEAEARKIRGEAEGLLERERAAATAEAEALLGAARQEAEEALATAQAAATAELEAAKLEGRRIVAEARALRKQMLGELVDKRRVALRQVEQLLAGRERLIESYKVATSVAEQALLEMEHAEQRAQEAAVAAVGEDVPPEDEARAAEIIELDRAAAQIPVVVKPVDEPEEATGETPTVEPPAASGSEPAGAESPTPAVVVSESPPSDTEREPARRGRMPAPPPVSLEPPPPPEAEAGWRSSALRIIRVDDDGNVIHEPEPVASPVAAEPEAERGPESATASSEPEASPRPTDDADDTVGVGDLDVVTVIDDVESVRVLRAEPEIVSDREPETEATSEPAPDADASEAHDDVGDLFARLRDARERNTAAARAVLGADEAAPSPAIDAVLDDETQPVPAEAQPPDEVAADDAEVLEPVVDTRPAVFAARDDAEAEHAPLVQRRLKRAVDDLQNDVMSAARTARGVPAATDVLGDLDAVRVTLAEAVSGPLGAALQAGIDAAGGLPDAGGVDGTDSALGLVDELLTPLADRLGRSLDEARSQLGAHRLDDIEIGERLSAVFREVKRSRLADLSTEAVRTAFSEGMLRGVGDARRVWRCDPDVGPCGPDCEDNSLADAVAAGDVFPTGDARPPARPGCRCLVVAAS